MVARLAIGIAVAAIGFGSVGAWAGPIGLQKDGNFPDLTCGWASSSYDTAPSALLFTVDAYPLTVFTSQHDAGTDFTDGVLRVRVTVDATGHATGGTFSLTGPANDNPANPYLSGVLALTDSFGYLNAGGPSAPFEFVFTDIGGTAAELFGSRVGVLYTPAASTFTGSFAAGFGDASENGFVDVYRMPASVPEPASLALLGAGTLGLLRRRKNATAA